MRRRWKRALGAVAAVVVVLVATWVGVCYAAPEAVLEAGERARIEGAGLTEDDVRVASHRIHYVHGGSGPTIVVFHGFADTAVSWAPVADALVDEHRFVLPELPGFGHSSRRPDASYGLTAQTDRMVAFLDELGIERFHLVGESMGGAIAGMFAARHPERVESLLLLCPAGVEQPSPSPYFQALAQGNNPLVVRDRDDLDMLMRYSFSEPPELIPWYVPRSPIRRAIVARLRRDADFYQRVFEDFREGERNPLNEALPRIEAPTRVLWGEDDMILDPSALQIVRQKLPTARTHRLEGCGHALHVECRDRVLSHLRQTVGGR